MKKLFIFLCYILAVGHICSQDINVNPTHWWVGMKSPELQIMIHGNKIGSANSTVKISYPGVSLKKVNRVTNSNYLFLDLTISPTAKEGKFNIVINNPDPQIAITIPYELHAKSKNDGKTRVLGVTAADFIYLIMPDRFSNGDPSNDVIQGMRDTDHDRNNPFDRHGGDILGVTNHLDYLKDLGITTVWLTPVVENDMARTQEGGTSRSTYHGYAFTDQYQIDRRFGGNEAYSQLVNTAHSKGMKIIQDAVYNHVGNDHWFVKDLPMNDWLNQWSSYTNTSYRDQPLDDPYASSIDKKITTDGWFTPFLPDLNQRNPYVSKFLIQYAIWATEEFGIDGWRVDTYFYNDPKFLNDINTALVNEFPKLTIFGETSVANPTQGAYFSDNNINTTYKSNLQGITDFPLTFAMLDGVNNVERIYTTLSQDFLYKNPMRNCIFLDNHDLDRFYSVVGEDFAKYKMAVALLLTTRGIPQIYYGSEILMKNFKNPSDAEVRRDFPGGWQTDPVNKFEQGGRTDLENQAFNYVKTLANFRKSSEAIQKGKLMQYVPDNGVYVYFRYTASETVMCVLNSNTNSSTINLSRFSERIGNFTKAKDVATGTIFNLEPTLTIGPKYLLVMELH
ncbi:MAG: alpha-amylase [Bacteroidetes bacterium]|nr:MAG: alpha-amylase [Bacteroidota bacterium]